MSAELGPKEGAAAKSVLETVLGKELRPSQVVLAQDTSVYLNIGDKDARRAEQALLDTPPSGPRSTCIPALLIMVYDRELIWTGWGNGSAWKSGTFGQAHEHVCAADSRVLRTLVRRGVRVGDETPTLAEEVIHHRSRL